MHKEKKLLLIIIFIILLVASLFVVRFFYVGITTDVAYLKTTVELLEEKNNKIDSLNNEILNLQDNLIKNKSLSFKEKESLYKKLVELNTEKEKEKNIYQKKLNDFETKLKDFEEKSQLNQIFKTDDNQEYKTEIDNLKVEIKGLEIQIDSLKKVNDDDKKGIVKKGKKLTIPQTARNNWEIPYPRYTYPLNNQQKSTLNMVIKRVKSLETENYNLLIEGHSPKIHDWERKNESISNSISLAVKEYLARQGVNKNNIRVSALGATKLKKKSKERSVVNARVEISLELIK